MPSMKTSATIGLEKAGQRYPSNVVFPQPDGPEQGHELTRLDLEPSLVKSNGVAVALGHAVELYHRLKACRLVSLPAVALSDQCASTLRIFSTSGVEIGSELDDASSASDRGRHARPQP